MKWIMALIAGMAIACAQQNQSGVAGGTPPEANNPANDPNNPDPPGTAEKLNARFDRVIWIVLENTNYSGAMKNSILKNFADLGIQFDQMMAETHPSQPNYIAMVAGDLLGVKSDYNYDLGTWNKSIADLLEKRGMDWRVYAEGFPGNCYTGATAGKYARKHVPFMSFLNITQSPQRCAKITNATNFQSDWANHRLPAYTMYVPDLNNDGHDTNVNFAADWFQQTFGSALKDSRLMEKTLVIVTFDESEGYFGANKIYTAMYSPNLPKGVHVKARHTHYSLLKMIEDEWGLGHLYKNDAKAPAITELQRGKN